MNTGKFLMFEAALEGTGWRPTVFLDRVVDSRGDVGPVGEPYYVFVVADDAAGLGSDELGYPYPQDANAEGLVHEMRLDDDADQWGFVEFVAMQDGAHELYLDLFQIDGERIGPLPGSFD